MSTDLTDLRANAKFLPVLRWVIEHGGKLVPAFGYINDFREAASWTDKAIPAKAIIDVVFPLMDTFPIQQKVESLSEEQVTEAAQALQQDALAMNIDWESVLRIVRFIIDLIQNWGQ